jgi:hypothetical protein
MLLMLAALALLVAAIGLLVPRDQPQRLGTIQTN